MVHIQKKKSKNTKTTIPFKNFRQTFLPPQRCPWQVLDSAVGRVPSWDPAPAYLRSSRSVSSGEFYSKVPSAQLDGD